MRGQLAFRKTWGWTGTVLWIGKQHVMIWVKRHWLYSVLQANLALHEGSGYFFVNTSVKGTVNVVFQEAQRTVQVRHSICDGISSWKYTTRILSNIISTLFKNPSNAENRDFDNENILSDLLRVPRFLPSTQGRWRSWFMTFVWHFKLLPWPQYTFLTSWRFMCEWLTRSVSSPIIPHLGGSRPCLINWSLLSVLHILAMLQWCLSTTYGSLLLALSFPIFMKARLFWISIIRFVLSVNQNDYTLMMYVIHLYYRWRLANLWELMSESWILIRSPSQPSISISWILNSRQLLQ